MEAETVAYSTPASAAPTDYCPDTRAVGGCLCSQFADCNDARERMLL